MPKLIIEVPEGDYCWTWEGENECTFFNGDWSRCEIFQKGIEKAYEDEDEIYLKGHLKCQDCKENSF